MSFTAPSHTALIIVDIQNDFCPGGALAVNEGDQIIPLVNDLSKSFEHRIYTQDFHPADHKSFASNHKGAEPFHTIETAYGVQVLWPDHCVQGTNGAEFHAALKMNKNDLVLKKGTNKEIDSYSGFFENDKKTRPCFVNGKTLTETLKSLNIKKVIFVGLAYDFCVGWHALDAKEEGFQAIVIKDATRSIAMPTDDGNNTETLMDKKLKQAGIEVTSLVNFFEKG